MPLVFKNFRHKWNLNRHIYNVHESEGVEQMRTNSAEKSLSCKVCPFLGSDFVALRNHQRTQTDIKHKPYICDICRKSYNRKDRLKNHFCTTSADKLLSCKVCLFSGSDYVALINHQRTQTDSKHKPYKCDICKKAYNRKNRLKVHVCRKASNIKKIKSVKTYKCSSCDRICIHKRILKDHTRKYHHSEQPVPCKKCDLIFPDLHHLNLHKVVHPGYNEYICNVCYFACDGMSKLRKHQRTHTGEKPYKCDICQSQFSGKDKLKLHRSRHDNSTYRCNNCAITCLDQSNLDHHNKKVHKMELIHGCKNCGLKFPDIQSLHMHILVCCFTLQESKIKFEPNEAEQDQEILKKQNHDPIKYLNYSNF